MKTNLIGQKIKIELYHPDTDYKFPVVQGRIVTTSKNTEGEIWYYVELSKKTKIYEEQYAEYLVIGETGYKRKNILAEHLLSSKKVYAWVSIVNNIRCLGKDEKDVKDSDTTFVSYGIVSKVNKIQKRY